MPTTIVIDGVTLTLKKYPEFAAGNPTATDITLFSDPINGDLFKTTMDNLIANILNVDGVTITGDGSSGNPITASGTVLADNGTHIDTGKVYLGGTLLENTTIDGDVSYTLTIQANHFSNTLKVTNNGGGTPLFAWNTSGSGNGILGQGPDNGVLGVSDGVFGAVEGQTTSGVAFYANLLGSTNNTVQNAIKIARQTPGTAANGVGSSIVFHANTDSSFELANEITSVWVDVTNITRTSQAKIRGVLAGATLDLITLNGDGSWQIRPITATAASAITPAEGMILFVSTTDATFTTIGFWGYANGAWAAF